MFLRHANPETHHILDNIQYLIDVNKKNRVHACKHTSSESLPLPDSSSTSPPKTLSRLLHRTCGSGCKPVHAYIHIYSCGWTDILIYTCLYTAYISTQTYSLLSTFPTTTYYTTHTQVFPDTLSSTFCFRPKTIVFPV